MLILRKILFYLFFLFYLLFCPFIILYALGIIFQPETKTIEKTGIIHISTVPPQATVYINNLRFPEKTPTIIRNLPPGQYGIKLFLRNHLAWEHTLPVQVEKATTAENILLIPKIWKSQTVSVQPYQRLIPLAGQTFLILAKSNVLKDCYIYRWNEGLKQILHSQNLLSKETQQLKPLLKEDNPYREAKLKKYFSIENSSVILLLAEFEGEQKFLWIDLKPDPPFIRDITDLFISAPESILWDPKDPKIIFSFQKYSLNRLDVESKGIYPKITEEVRGFNLFNRQLYVWTQDNTLKRLDYEAANPQVLLKILQPNRPLWKEAEKIQLEVLKENRYLLLSRQGAFISNEFLNRVVDQDVNGIRFDENRKRLLIWTNNKLGILDFSKDGHSENQEGDTRDEPRITWLVTDARKIEQAFWVNKEACILYQDNDQVFIIETKVFGNTPPSKITEIKNNSAIGYSDSLGTVFYLHQTTGQLSAIEILPPGTAFSLFDLEKETLGN